MLEKAAHFFSAPDSGVVLRFDNPELLDHPVPPQKARDVILWNEEIENDFRKLSERYEGVLQMPNVEEKVLIPGVPEIIAA